MQATRVHIFVFGEVHGVTFRANTARRARSLGLTGWVKNTQEGVEAVVEGEREQINQLAEWMRQGPPGAEVKMVDVREEQYKGEFRDFEIRY